MTIQTCATCRWWDRDSTVMRPVLQNPDNRPQPTEWRTYPGLHECHLNPVLVDKCGDDWCSHHKPREQE